MKYSILTINYNNREGLTRTIRSVLAQTCTDYEFLIVDGGSTDGSVDVIRAHADRLAYWVSEPDGGIYPAMNKATAHAHGEYCIYMNSGDCFFDERVLEEVAPRLDADIVLGKGRMGSEEKVFPTDTPTLRHLAKEGIHHQSAFIRRSVLGENPYDTRFKLVADYYFFVQRLVFGNASFRRIDRMVCRAEPGGVSDVERGKIRAERHAVLEDLIPPRILSDCEEWLRVDNPLLALTPQLNQTYRLNRIVYALVERLLRLDQWLFRRAR